MEIEFTKMDGLGNQFVIVDMRYNPFDLNSALVKHLSGDSNHFTKGCDQLLALYKDAKADIYMKIFNKDGSIASACGNASRCVAWLINKNEKKERFVIRTDSETLIAKVSSEKVLVNMGKPKFLLPEIPAIDDITKFNFSALNSNLKQYHLVNVGNPHIVFYVDSLDGLDVKNVGVQVQTAKIEGKDIFPKGINVNFAKKISNKEIELVVYERGAGLTLACGTGACASVVVGVNNFGLENNVNVNQKGGQLTIGYGGENSDITMFGGVNFQFNGKIKI